MLPRRGGKDVAFFATQQFATYSGIFGILVLRCAFMVIFGIKFSVFSNYLGSFLYYFYQVFTIFSLERDLRLIVFQKKELQDFQKRSLSNAKT